MIICSNIIEAVLFLVFNRIFFFFKNRKSNDLRKDSPNVIVVKILKFFLDKTQKSIFDYL